MSADQRWQQVIRHVPDKGNDLRAAIRGREDRTGKPIHIGTELDVHRTVEGSQPREAMISAPPK